MFKKYSELIEKLFEYNLEVFAQKLGLIDKIDVQISDSEIHKLLNIAEEISRKGIGDKDLATCLFICAIVLENKKAEWNNIEPFIAQIIFRLGLNPTVRMFAWNEEKNKFIGLGNVISELTSTSYLIDYQESFGQTSLLLSKFQKRVWDALETNQYVGISAPTSAGKSFVLVRKLIDELNKKGGHLVYIVPTLSLINQVVRDFKEVIKDNELSGFTVSQNIFNKSYFEKEKVIYVATQERIFTALENSDYDFENLKFLVIDEIQNLERLINNDSDRPKILYDCIQEVHSRNSNTKIIFSGPLIKNISSVLELFFEEEKYESISEFLSPVVNITYSFKKINRNTEELEFVQSIPFWKSQSLQVKDNFQLRDKVLGRKSYSHSDRTHDFIEYLLLKLKDESNNIVFSKSSNQAVKTANALITNLDSIFNTPKLKSLKKYLKETVHAKYDLISTIDKGVAYHHGKIPTHVRNSIEHAYKKKIINTIVCTTTLMQGVNLPAKNLIIRNPDVGKEKLSNYEFANLRGRTGRLMEDLIGRAFIIDNKSFEDEHIDLGEFEGKEINITYEDKFNERNKEFQEYLLNNSKYDGEEKDVLIYIRQKILQHKSNAQKELIKVGIDIYPEILKEIEIQLNTLKAPKSFITLHRFWDPIDLEWLYMLHERNLIPVIPRNPFDFNLSTILQNTLEIMIWNFPYYSDRYLNTKFVNEKYIQGLSLSAESWARGLSLKKVISPTNWPINESKEVDERVNRLYSKIKYGIPKLLAPIVYLQDHENPILTAIELGAFKPEIRFLIQMGLPRESAIRLDDFFDLNFMESPDQANIVQLNKIMVKALNDKRLSYWDKIQIEDYYFQ